MNEQVPLEESDPLDPAVEQLTLLQQLEPSRDSKILLRKVIAEELIAECSSLPDKSASPWWWRRIAIPLPLTLAACVIWLMPFVWFIPWQVAKDRSDKVNENKSVISSPNSNAFVTVEHRRQAYEEASSYSFHATYLCGVGQIQNTTIYSFED